MNNTKKSTMKDTKNALVKLAEEIESANREIVVRGGYRLLSLDKAQRIVVKLASYYEPCFPIKSGDDVIDECRAIAERDAE